VGDEALGSSPAMPEDGNESPNPRCFSHCRHVSRRTYNYKQRKASRAQPPAVRRKEAKAGRTGPW